MCETWYSSGPSIVPVARYIVPVKSLGTDEINQCGSVRSNSAGCRYSAAGIFGWHKPAL